MSTADAEAVSSADRRGTGRLGRGIGRRPAGTEAREVLSGLNRGAILSRLQVTYQAKVGRGFYALLSTAVPAARPTAPHAEAHASEYRVVLVDIHTALPNPYRPPVVVEEEALNRLARNIQEQGLLEPIQVMASPQTMEDDTPRYWVISGERRRQAAIRAGLHRLPVIIKDVSVRAALQMFLSQAIHSQSLSDLERAQVYAALITKMGMTVEEVAKRVGVPAEEIMLTTSALNKPTQLQLSRGPA